MSIRKKLIWMQSKKAISIFTLLLLSLAAVTSVFAASSPERLDHDLCPTEGEGHRCAYEAFPVIAGNLVRSPSMELATPRIITAEIQSFTELELTIDLTEDFPAGIGTPFTYRLSFLVATGATVSNVNATPTGGGTCSVLPNLDISCSGVLTSLVITYRYAYTPDLYPPYVLLGVGGSDTTSVDYTVNVSYPANFTFVDSTPPPDSHDPGTRSLVWTQDNSFQFIPEMRFQALDLSGAWLPFIMR